MSDDKRHLNESWLRKMYIEEELSALEISSLVDKHTQTIYSAMRRFGIQRRSHLAGKEDSDDEMVYQNNLERDKQYDYANGSRGNGSRGFEKVRDDLSCECGIEENAVLEFHHTDETEYNLSFREMVRVLSNEELEKELERGRMLCANCHARHHRG